MAALLHIGRTSLPDAQPWRKGLLVPSVCCRSVSVKVGLLLGIERVITALLLNQLLMGAFLHQRPESIIKMRSAERMVLSRWVMKKTVEPSKAFLRLRQT